MRAYSKWPRPSGRSDSAPSLPADAALPLALQSRVPSPSSFPRARAAFLAALSCAAAACAPDLAFRRQLAQADRAIHHGRYAQAERSLDAAEKAGAAWPAGDPRRAEVWRLEADVRLLQDQPDRALPLYEKAYQAMRAAHGASSPEARSALLDIADLRAARGDSAEAEKLYRQVLTEAERSGGGQDGELAARLSDLAMVCQAAGKPAEAERLYRRALQETERELGPGHPLFAARLNDLGLLLQSLGRADEAEKAYRRALAVEEKALPAGHPDLDAALNQLGLFLESRGRNADAEALYRRALEQARQRGRSARSAARPNYASLLRRLGRDAEAAALEAGGPAPKPGGKP